MDSHITKYQQKLVINRKKTVHAYKKAITACDKN